MSFSGLSSVILLQCHSEPPRHRIAGVVGFTGSEHTAVEHHRQGKCFSVRWPLLCRTTTENNRSPVMLTSISATPSTRHSHPRIPCVFSYARQSPPWCVAYVPRERIFDRQWRGVFPEPWHHARPAEPAGHSPHPEPPSAEHPDRSHDHHAEHEYGLPPPSPSVQASDAHHPGETFTVCRLRNICDRIIHRLLQNIGIIVTTVARNRDMAYSLLHHLFKHRTHIIRVRLLPSAGCGIFATASFTAFCSTSGS